MDLPAPQDNKMVFGVTKESLHGSARVSLRAADGSESTLRSEFCAVEFGD